jgi:hypothetical protein
MRSVLAATIAIVATLAHAAGAQTWNDPRSRALVERATLRRAQQLADTGLTDYQATAHGYVTFLAQLGEGFPTPPKIIKADELELEVYWHAPNLSKQRIVGRRDTLLLPTDIAYHEDHLGIVQNNFPSVIRIGDGDEVRDVPHPLSPAGLGDYDFALTDSFAIGSGSQRINVYEIKVRPKDDRQPRVVGAIYLDPSEGQVVRMNLSFTHAAFLDKSLEQLSVVLENRLVTGRYWLPSRQEIEIRRSGTWLDYPVRGIIRGRWEIGDYRFETNVPRALFAGPEIVQMPAVQLRQYHWSGAILDSLPPDVRAATEEDVKRVQDEARALVRAQALSRAQHVTLSARSISDFARYDRVEGLAIGDGLSKQFGSGFTATVRGRYGLDDRDGKGSAELAWQSGSGFMVRAFGIRDFRDVGDVAERSGVINSLAAQEFGSDYSDPYLARGGGLGVQFAPASGLRWSAEAGYESQSALGVHARPVTGAFEPVVPAADERVVRLVGRVDRPPSLWVWGTELSGRVELRETLPQASSLSRFGLGYFNATRVSATADIERPFDGSQRLVLQTVAGWLVKHKGEALDPPQQFVYFGGPVSAPGYDYHSLVTPLGFSQRIELRTPAYFPAFSLGRFGHVPGRATIAPYLNLVGTADLGHCVVPQTPGIVSTLPTTCPIENGGLFPSFGLGYLLPFDLARFDVARGVGRGGRWTFSFDVSRDFWSVL